MRFSQQTQTPGASSSRIGLFLYYFIDDDPHKHADGDVGNEQSRQSQCYNAFSAFAWRICVFI